MRPAPDHQILDVGVTADRSYTHSNYLECWMPNPSRITAAGLDDAAFLEEEYPGLRFVRCDGRSLPFADNSQDYVHSSAVLEHAGGIAQQQKFVSEMFRVARRGIFLTTPNRWFPIEFHSMLPLLHWLPKPAFRAFLLKWGLPELSLEENLNLLTATELAAIAARCDIANAKVSSVSLAGWPTNLLLIAHK